MKTKILLTLLLLQFTFIFYQWKEYDQLYQFTFQIKDRLNHDRIQLTSLLAKECK